MLKPLDPLLHSELRLAVISILISVKEAEFSYIKEKTGATSGNLSVQLTKLQDANYIKIEKSFIGWNKGKRFSPEHKEKIWERNKEKFLYEHEGKTRYYIPDFKINDFFIEVKGFVTNKDNSKWRDFPYKLVVIKEKDIVDMECGGLPKWS